MKTIIIGLGQCGGRIADEFSRLGRRARGLRGIDIIVDSFAVNSDTTDLAGLQTIKEDYRHRILIGAGVTHGHGVAKINEVGAEIACADADKILDNIKSAPRFQEADAFLLVASAAGGTGSGAAPVITRAIKGRYVDKPVYVMLVLPFEHEELNEERALYNTAVCLKSTYSVADAVILIDNQRYVRKDYSLQSNLGAINRLIVEPFFDLLCAGEEKKSQNIGAKVMDAGDIIQTLCGWTAIGYGEMQLPLITFGRGVVRNFHDHGTQSHKGIQVMDRALSDLSVECNPADAHRAMYLISAPGKEMHMELIKELDCYLKKFAPQAVIRNGDYPREKGLMDITVVISELSDVPKVRRYYEKSTELAKEIKLRAEMKASKAMLAEEAGKDVPTLL